MKKVLLLSLLAGALASHSASAKIRTFEYTAVLWEITVDQRYVSSAPGLVAGTYVTEGDQIRGSFSFDDLDFSSATYDFDYYQAISLNATFVRDGTSFVESNPWWEIAPPQYEKSFAIGTHYTSKAPSLSLRIDVADRWSETPYNMVDSFNQQSWWNVVRMNWGNVHADFRSLEWQEVEVSPVPEPSTYAMLLLGAAVVTGAAKRRAGRKAA